MATAKVNKPAENTDNRVDVFIPRGQQNDDPNYMVSINGVNYILPRGKTSRVPYEVAYEISRARAAEEALDAKMQAMIDASK